MVRQLEAPDRSRQMPPEAGRESQTQNPKRRARRTGLRILMGGVLAAVGAGGALAGAEHFGILPHAASHSPVEMMMTPTDGDVSPSIDSSLLQSLSVHDQQLVHEFLSGQLHAPDYVTNAGQPSHDFSITGSPGSFWANPVDLGVYTAPNGEHYMLAGIEDMHDKPVAISLVDLGNGDNRAAIIDGKPGHDNDMVVFTLTHGFAPNNVDGFTDGGSAKDVSMDTAITHLEADAGQKVVVLVPEQPLSQSQVDPNFPTSVSAQEYAVAHDTPAIAQAGIRLQGDTASLDNLDPSNRGLSLLQEGQFAGFYLDPSTHTVQAYGFDNTGNPAQATPFSRVVEFPEG